MVKIQTSGPDPVPAQIIPLNSGKTLATAAMILGIVSVIFPIVGLVAAILAIIFAIVSFHKKTTYKNFATTGLVTGLIGIIFSAISIALVSWLITNPPTGNILFPTGGSRTAMVNAQAAEKKDFTIGETAKIGGVDVKITNVTRQYVPTAAEMKIISLNDPRPETDPRGAGYPIPVNGVIAKDQAEYVRIDGTANYNNSDSLGDNNSISSMLLNNVYPALYNGDDNRYNTELSNDPMPISYLYRIRKDSTALTLTYTANVYTSVSWLVGTEGAPSRNFKYSIKLN